MSINPAQQQAIDYDGGHLLIIAGPGTGKTHTLTHRVIRLAQNLDKDRKVLAITFTKKASQEMRGRLERNNPDIKDKVFVGTFHGFCQDILRAHGGQGVFSLVSEEEIEDVAKTLWPDKKGKERRGLLNEISAYKSVHFREDEPDYVKVFNQELRKRNAYDFDDLLLNAWRLAQSRHSVLEDLQDLYPVICVDEYQDINTIQHVLLQQWVGSSGTITAIGDPNQAIYGFRGSDLKFFDSFKEDFPATAVLSLSDNYRCARNILSASSQVMAKTANDYLPKLTARIYTQGQLVVYEAATENAEAEYVVREVEKMVGGTSMFSHDSARVSSGQAGEVSFGDIAVLYRLNSQAHALKKAFDRSGIPFCLSQSLKDDEGDDVCPRRGKEVVFEAEKVSLMSLHAAKGLEFVVVFMVGCEENILPLNLQGLEADGEEERRLFYVGITRAKDKVFLTHAKRRILYGRVMNNRISPFVLDIEEKLKEYDKAVLKLRKQKQEEQMSFF